jgi:hypothetical protein
LSSYDSFVAQTIAAIDSNVIAYGILDMIDEKKLFYVYALRAWSNQS